MANVGGGDIGIVTMTSTPLHTTQVGMVTLAYDLVVWGLVSPKAGGNSLRNCGRARAVTVKQARGTCSPALTSGRPPWPTRA